MKDRKIIRITKEAVEDIAASLRKEKPTEVFIDSTQVCQDNDGDLYLPRVTICILGYTLIGDLYISRDNKLDAVATVALTMARATGDGSKWSEWAQEMGYTNFAIPEEYLRDLEQE